LIWGGKKLSAKEFKESPAPGKRGQEGRSFAQKWWGGGGGERVRSIDPLQRDELKKKKPFIAYARKKKKERGKNLSTIRLSMKGTQKQS